MANSNIELMRGVPENAIRKLAWPIMVSMMLTASYNIVDGIWIAGLGPTAIAGIGFVSPLFMILNGTSVGLGIGATSLISRYIGAKNKENASNAAKNSLLIFVIASIFLTILLLVIQKPVLMAYGASGLVLKEALNYSTVLFIGLFTFIFANGCSGILRGEGDMKRAMYAIIVSVIMNAILDPIFIYVLGFGSRGASLATITSSFCASVVILYWILVKKNTYVNVTFRKFKYSSKMIKDMLKVGIPSSFEMCVMSLAAALYLSFITSIGGEYGVAAYSSGIRLYLFVIMPLTAIGSSVVAVGGSAFGAKNGDYLSRAHIYGAKLGVSIGFFMTFIFLLFSNQLATIFAYTHETAKLVPEISEFLKIATLALGFTGAGLVSGSIFQSLGKGVYSLFFTLLREVIITVPLTYIIGIQMGYGLTGIWIGLAIGRSIASCITFIFTRFIISKRRKTWNS